MNRLGQVFKALSDETRLTIMGLVFRHGHLCVCEVERILAELRDTHRRAGRHAAARQSEGTRNRCTHPIRRSQPTPPS